MSLKSSMSRATAVASLVALSLSCSDVVTTRPPTASRPQPVAQALVLTPSSMLLRQGDAAALVAEILMSDGTRHPTTAQLSATNAAIASIRDGQVFGLSAGSTTIVALADGLAAEASVVVVPVPTGGSADALVVQRFYMIELPYNSVQGEWQYAPQLRVVAAPGRTAYITQISFAIPGLGSIPPIDCFVHLTDATLLDLNSDFYGDWATTIDSSRQASGTEATATIGVIDDSGKATTVSATGPIVHGGPPANYPGVRVWGSSDTCIDVGRTIQGG
jgi:hypothetical protein